MPFFRRMKSTSNLHQPREYKPHDILEECLELECLIEDMKSEYIYMFQPYQHFQHPTPFSLHEIPTELRANK